MRNSYIWGSLFVSAAFLVLGLSGRASSFSGCALAVSGGGESCPSGCTMTVTEKSKTQGGEVCLVTFNISVTCSSGESCGPVEQTVNCGENGAIDMQCGGCCFSADPGGTGTCSGANWGGMPVTYRCACYPATATAGACP